MIDGYGDSTSMPSIHFGEGYTGTFEMTEESRKELDELVKKWDEEAVQFFDVFEHDLICCIHWSRFNYGCNHCHLKGIKDCESILEDNVKRMIDNQKRIVIEFNKQRSEKK